MQRRRKGKKLGTAGGRGYHPHRPGEDAGGGTPPDQLGSAVSSPTGVWGSALEANAFCRKNSRTICTIYVKPFEM